MKYWIRRSLILIAMIMVIPAFAQDEEKELLDLDLTFTLHKLFDGSRSLNIKAGARIDKVFIPAEGLPFTFFGDHFGEEIEIGHATTDQYGVAKLVIDNSTPLPTMDSAGNYYLIAKFDGDENYFESEAEIEAREGFIEMTIDEEADARNVSVKVFGLNEEGEELPVEWASVSLYVPRLFSMLRVQEEFTDEEGMAYFEFPDDIPGDEQGNLVIFARFEDDEFGMLETKTEKPWGIPSVAESNLNVRALWSTNAPFWMIITLVILILGVWVNYIFVVSNLLKIKRENKSELPREIDWETE